MGFRDFTLRFCGFPGFPGRTWVLFSAILWVSGISWENLGVIFCAFVGFPGFPGRTWVETVMGGELQELVLAGGWPAILTRNF